MSTIRQVGLYLVHATAGSGLPGAPTLHLALAVNAPTGAITGHAVLTQAITGSNANITIPVTGTVQATGFGKFTKVFALNGTAAISLPPPAIGTYTEAFSCHFAVDNSWDGVGGWTLGAQAINSVPIRGTAV